MAVKVAAFYLVSIASSLLAASQVAPSMNAVLSNESARSAITSYQRDTSSPPFIPSATSPKVAVCWPTGRK
jgi:hypothetical protein